MRKILKFISIIFLLSAFLLTGCNSSNEQSANNESSAQQGSSEISSENQENKETIKIASLSFNRDEVAADPAVQAMAEKGYDVEVVVLDNATIMNEALMEGSIDASLHQHHPWMNTYNEENGTDLVMMEPYIHLNTFSIMSDKYESVDELPDEATIIISSDQNQSRALKFLEELDFITLENGIENPRLSDVEDNPKKLNLVEVQHHQVVSSIPDADAVMTSTYLLIANDMSVEDYVIATSDDEEEYGVGFVVKPEDVDSDWVNAIMQSYTSPKMADWINELFKGGFIPGFE